MEICVELTVEELIEILEALRASDGDRALIAKLQARINDVRE
jgi:hypothetical protein